MITLSSLIVSNVITFILLFSTEGYQSTIAPLYGNEILRLTPGAIGAVVGFTTMLRFVMSLVGGELSDRLRHRAVLVPGLVLMGIGTLMFNSASGLETYWTAMLVLSIWRFGNNVPAGVLADHASPERWGFHLGLNRMIGDLAMVLGPVAMGVMLENYGYGMTTIISAVIPSLSVIAAAVGISEVHAHAPVAVQVRSLWAQARTAGSRVTTGKRL